MLLAAEGADFNQQNKQAQLYYAVQGNAVQLAVGGILAESLLVQRPAETENVTA